jgi:hypothetical protein
MVLVNKQYIQGDSIMAKRFNRNNPRPPMVVASGDGWRIEFDPHAGDYAAWIDWNVIGYYSSQSKAQSAVDEYRYDELARAGLPILARAGAL